VTPKRAEPDLILAVDIGTSSVRTALFDRLGRAVEGAEACHANRIRTAVDGAAEADANDLLERMWQCLDSVLERAGELTRHISGVAACTFVNNILGVDDAGRAITPLTTYADTRGASHVAGLRAEFDEVVVHDRTGCHFHPSYLPARFRWLAQAQPELFRQVARWVSIGEYLELKLFGEAAASYSVASWTGLLDRHTLEWDRELIAALPVGIGHLSPLSDVDSPRRVLRPEFADRWPALRDVPWFPAVGDGAAANIGSGCVSPTRMTLTMGTTSAIRTVVATPVPSIPNGLWCYRVDRRRSLPGGALNEGGNVFAWMKDSLELGDLAKLESVLAASEPDAHGLTVLPFFAGERSPGWSGDARATIHGLSLASTSLDILRAGLEAVAYRIALVAEMLGRLLPGEAQIVASGGALLGSPTWLQIITDVLGRQVIVSEVEQASARGAALLALEALGVLKDVGDAPDFTGTSHEPDLTRHARYREAMDRQQRLYERLIQPRA